MLVVARLICRDAFFCGAEPSRKREREKERETYVHGPSIFHADGDASPRDETLSIFTFAPRVTDVTRVRRRRKHLSPETCVWTRTSSVWESVTSKWQSENIYINCERQTGTTGILFSPVKDTSIRYQKDVCYRFSKILLVRSQNHIEFK